MRDMILILDFGGNHAYYTARRLRAERFYCEVLPGDIPHERVAELAPKGVVLAGGEAEVEAAGVGTLPFDAETLGVPVLAFGAAARMMASRIGASHGGVALRDAKASVTFSACELFSDLVQSDRRFDRLDRYDNFPEGWNAVATTSDELPAAFGNAAKQLYGLQFYVESNDPDGFRILENFSERVCGCAREWTVESFAPRLLEQVRRDTEGLRVLVPVSGGVDSAVTAALLQKAIGSRLTCLFIDTGFLRKGDADIVSRCFYEQMGLSLIRLDARERFMRALAGISESERKRSAIREEFSAIFAEEYVTAGEFECMAEGTIYPDVLHHRPRLVSNLIDGCKRIEPLRFLLKDDVRALGRWLGVPEELVNRSAFENCGLAIRCLGAVTPERLRTLRAADSIFAEELERAGLTKRISQHFAILTELHTPGEKDGCVCVLRAMGNSSEGRAPAYKLPYDLMEVVVRRITREVNGINRVVYDITGRPTASVEWE